jgi:hypothetical protein
VNGIESHPFHREIADEWLLVHQATDPKHPSLTSFFPKNETGKRPSTVYRVLTVANLLRVALPCSRRGHAAQPLSWRAVLHLMLDTLYFRLLEFVRFEHLSNDRICEFVNRMAELDVGLNSRLLVNVLNRLVCHVDISHFACDISHYSVGYSDLQFVPDSDPLDGIIGCLTGRFGENVHSKNVIQITSSKPLTKQHTNATKNIADQKVNSQFFF